MDQLYNMNMRKIVVLTFVSLDGVMQAPGGKGEDPSGGFDLEGWTVPLFDEDLGSEMGKQMGQPFDLLLGRKTYEIFASYWPQQGDDNPINQATKYVVSNGAVNTQWKETVQIQGDAAAELKKLKQQDGPMLQVHGSSNLIQTLLAHDLVDEIWIKIFPVTLGKGKRLFGEGTIPAAFKVTESTVSAGGVIIASYKRDGEVKLGSF
jgi:dihydrofolate reductase